jgi:hypothetical protein
MPEATVSTNIRLPEGLHKRLDEHKKAGGPPINTQIVWALQDYQALAEKHQAAQRQVEALQEQLAAAQLAHQQALAQVEALMRLHAELSGQQLAQLAQSLTEAHRAVLIDSAMHTARAVRRELRGPAAHRRERPPARRGVSQVGRTRRLKK